MFPGNTVELSTVEQAKRGSQGLAALVKLLYALSIDRYARRHVGDDWSRLERQRPATWWRVWKIIRREVAEWITGVLHWRQDHWQGCFEVMQERPRRRKLQALPEGINPLLEVCRKAGLCAM